MLNLILSEVYKVKKDIKNEILRVSRELFNKNGYGDVSMRNIADALGISVGNLTYHYKRKEDLIEAVLMEQHDVYIKPRPAENLVELNDFFADIIKFNDDNSFNFKDFKQLEETSQKGYAMQMAVVNDLRQALTDTFKNLQTSGFIKRDSFPDQNQCLIEIMTGICVNGTISGMDRAKCLWSIIYLILK